MDLGKVKHYRSSYVIGGTDWFSKWLIGNLDKAKSNITCDVNFKAFLVPPDPIPFLSVFDVYDGMPYRLSLGNDFGKDQKEFLIEISYLEK